MAENPDGQEKTESPTGKRLGEARDRGQVAKSMDIVTAAVLLLGGMMLFILGGPMVDNFKHFLIDSLRHCASVQITDQNAASKYFEIIIFMGQLLLPFLLVLFVIVFASEVSQVGFHIAPKKFTEGLNFKQIFNPFSGLKRMMISKRSAFELIKGVVKIIIIGVVVYQVLASKTEETIALVERPFENIGQFLVDMSYEIFLKVGTIYILIAVADFFYQRYQFTEDMKMTKQEVREEGKQMEGDPMIKSRIRSIMRQRIRQMMLKNVKSAEVVITNPTHFAVALSYKQETMNAPVVVGKGVDYLALQIKEIAIENNIPIVEEPPLARALYYAVEVDQEIPENLFKAVAQILAYVYSLKNKVKLF